MTVGPPVPPAGVAPGEVAEVGAARSDLRPVVASGLVRTALLPVSAALNLVTAGVLLDAVGVASYGAVILVGTLFQLLPFADFGVGTAVTRAIAAADDPRTDDHVAQVVRRSVRVLLASGAGLAAVSVGLGLLGAWGPLLGFEGPDAGGSIARPDLTATLTLVLFAVALPLTLGQRILLGGGKNHLAVAATAAQPVTALALAGGLLLIDAPANAFVLVYPAGFFATAAAATLLARRMVGIRLEVRGPAHARVLPYALPAFLITIGFPVGLQSDKLVISHQLSAAALTEYALAFQLYVPAWSVLSTAGMALLPVFARRRARGQGFRRLWVRVVLAFGGASATCGLLFVLLAPLVADLVSSGRILIGLDVRLAFAALLVVQTVSLVTGMTFTRPAELRIQATGVLNMMVANLALSWLLAQRLGVAGPVLASAVTLAVLVWIPSSVSAARTSSAQVPRQGSAPDAVALDSSPAAVDTRVA